MEISPRARQQTLSTANHVWPDAKLMRLRMSSPGALCLVDVEVGGEAGVMTNAVTAHSVGTRSGFR